MPATQEDVRTALTQVKDPALQIDFVTADMVKGIEVDARGAAKITIQLTTPACPSKDVIVKSIQAAVGYELCKDRAFPF
jgi:metal-sulfur cluster biosynthetic enzyme